MQQQVRPELDAIYRAYHVRVVRYAARLIGREDAEDVAQEVFLKVGRALGALSDPTRLSSWIFAITANTVRDVARARATRISRISCGPSDHAAGEEPVQVVSDESLPSAEHLVAKSEMVACYLGFVEQLPPSYHDVYVLSELEGLSNAEIASRLSITVGAAKIRLHRARSRLFAELRDHCRCYVDDRGELMAEPQLGPPLAAPTDPP